VAVVLPVPDVSWATTGISLGGTDYSLTYSYNERDSRWRLDIEDAIGGIIFGVKIMESQSLLSPYILARFDHGDIVCVRVEEDNKPVGRKNIGIDLPYELIYFSNTEIEELQSD
jgi:hypothetical protein